MGFLKYINSARSFRQINRGVTIHKNSQDERRQNTDFTGTRQEFTINLKKISKIKIMLQKDLYTAFLLNFPQTQQTDVFFIIYF